jgi:hypothetical protein
MDLHYEPCFEALFCFMIMTLTKTVRLAEICKKKEATGLGKSANPTEDSHCIPSPLVNLYCAAIEKKIETERKAEKKGLARSQNYRNTLAYHSTPQAKVPSTSEKKLH